MAAVEYRREKYIQDLVLRMGNGLIKVITGMRRVGKSYLLFKLFRDYLRDHSVEDSHIISMEFDRWECRMYRNPERFMAWVAEQIVDDGIYYILLDEVQMLTSFEEVLNSLLHIRNADIYVTGSNSKFLSKDVITEFRGRGDEIHVYPLTFREYMQRFSGDTYHGWAEYYTYGGLPAVAGMQTDSQKMGYLGSLFREVYFKDIMERNQLSLSQELDDLVNILASSVGSLTNPSRIESTFKTVLRSGISVNTIKQYIGFLEDSFLIDEACRYDIKGRKYIGSLLKYYFEDVGLRNARIGFRQTEETHLMENILYNELRYRGFCVDVGIVEDRTKDEDGICQRRQLEIDFVAHQGSLRYYIQSALSLLDEAKIQQEKASFYKVRDFHKRIIVVKDVMPVQRDEAGIVTISLYDFLLNPRSLEL